MLFDGTGEKQMFLDKIGLASQDNPQIEETAKGYHVVTFHCDQKFAFEFKEMIQKKVRLVGHHYENSIIRVNKYCPLSISQIPS
jgi:hypothetical protein